MAISAAISTCSGEPPSVWARPEAAMALETPISAWQPPMAADSVAPFLNTRPITPAVSKNGSTADSPAIVEADAIQEHGRDHARRPVGRRRHHPAERRVLLVDRQGEAAHPLENLGKPAPLVADGGDPGVGVRVGSIAG